MPIFCRKNVHPLQNTVLYVIGIKCFMKTPSFRVFSQNASNLPKLQYIMGYKSIRYPFFRFFTKKTMLSCTYFVKNVHSQKNTMLSCPYFVKKRPFSLKHCAFMSFFFNLFYEKPPAAMPIFRPKNVNSVKTTLNG